MRFRGEGAGDLKRRESDVLIEIWTDPKILMDDKSWKTWKSNQNVVMDEELVQKIVMNGKIVKNFVVMKIGSITS